MKFTYQLWNEHCERLGAKIIAPSYLFYQVVSLYEQSGNAFHSLEEHIEPGFDSLEEYHSLALNPDELWIAWATHDMICRAGSKTNEVESGRLIRAMLEEIGVRSVAPLLVQNLVEQTDHVWPSTYPDIRLICDIDLIPLALPEHKFDANGLLIRSENGCFDDETFWRGRVAFFRQMLDRKNIYQTPELSSRYEAAARHNLERTIREVARTYP